MSLTLIQKYVQDMNEAIEELELADPVEKQFAELYKLEKQFSKALRGVNGGKQVYHEFITFIRRHNHGLLAARPYFRLREDLYKDSVNYAIDHSQPKMLHDININFKFCKFAIETLDRADKKNANLSGLFERIKAAREKIITRYLLVAMTNAKRHKRASSTMDFSDLVQNANEGLISAVDKYVMEEGGTAFHKVAIGLMVAYLINGNNLNLSVSIGPHAGKKLYRIKRILEKLPNATALEIAKIVESTEFEVAELMAASSYMSLDKEFDGTDMRMVDTLARPADSTNDPYLMVEHSDLMESLKDFMSTLTLIERKVLTLKGVQGILTEVQVEDLK